MLGRYGFRNPEQAIIGMDRIGLLFVLVVMAWILWPSIAAIRDQAREMRLLEKAQRNFKHTLRGLLVLYETGLPKAKAFLSRIRSKRK